MQVRRNRFGDIPSTTGRDYHATWRRFSVFSPEKKDRTVKAPPRRRWFLALCWRQRRWPQRTNGRSLAASSAGRGRKRRRRLRRPTVNLTFREKEFPTPPPPRDFDGSEEIAFLRYFSPSYFAARPTDGRKSQSGLVRERNLCCPPQLAARRRWRRHVTGSSPQRPRRRPQRLRVPLFLVCQILRGRFIFRAAHVKAPRIGHKVRPSVRPAEDGGGDGA